MIAQTKNGPAEYACRAAKGRNSACDAMEAEDPAALLSKVKALRNGVNAKEAAPGGVRTASSVARWGAKRAGTIVSRARCRRQSPRACGRAREGPRSRSGR